MISDFPELMTPTQYAQATGSNACFVRRQCADGVLPAQKIGNKWYLPRDLLFPNILRKEEEWKQEKSAPTANQA